MEETIPVKTKRSPSPRQRKAAKEVVKNLLKDQPLPNGRVLENVGYSDKFAETPNRVLQSEGFKLALSEMGLKEALINEGINPAKIAQKINVLLDATRNDEPDINAIDKGISHATKIFGVLDETPKSPQNTYNFIFSAPVQKEVKEMEDRIKQHLTKKNVQEN